jgi:thiamine-monophosphate kinase
VLVGPGDDCALLGDAPGRLLVTTDQVIEGVHFHGEASVEHIANHALGRALSDIASMGGLPIASTATAAIREGYTHADALFEAMHGLSLEWNCPLIGGDIASHDGAIVISVTMLGREHASRGSVLRSGARAGDGIYVTGTLGEAKQSGWTTPVRPRVREAQSLCGTLGDRLHAMIDLSDGLGIDAGRIARMSGVGIQLQLDEVPCAGGSTPEIAAGGGGDYELCFAAAGEVADLCPATGTPITRVGKVFDGSGVVAVRADGSKVEISSLGWDHTL